MTDKKLTAPVALPFTLGPTKFSRGGPLYMTSYVEGDDADLCLFTSSDAATVDMKLTTYLDEPHLDFDEVWVKDYSENEGALDALIACGAVSYSGETAPVGPYGAVLHRCRLCDKIKGLYESHAFLSDAALSGYDDEEPWVDER